MNVREWVGPREVQFYTGLVLIAFAPLWPRVAGAVLVLYVMVGPILARLGGRS